MNNLLSKVKNFFVEKRWAFAAILIGVLAGFLSAVICVRGNLVIFGFNIMFIVPAYCRICGVIYSPTKVQEEYWSHQCPFDIYNDQRLLLAFPQRPNSP